MLKADTARGTAVCRSAPTTSHIRIHRVAKAQRMPHTRWLAKSPMATGIAMPTAARRPSAQARSFTSLCECNDTKARQAFCHLDLEITLELLTFIKLLACSAQEFRRKDCWP